MLESLACAGPRQGASDVSEQRLQESQVDPNAAAELPSCCGAAVKKR